MRRPAPGLRAALAAVPRLYSQEDAPEPIAHVKFFTPDAQATWLVLEWDGDDQLFTFACLGDCQSAELGYASLSELESLQGPLGLQVEHDAHFRPTPLTQAKGALCGGLHR